MTATTSLIDDLPQATHEGKLTIGGLTMRVYRLDDGRAIINADDMAAFFDAMENGIQFTHEECVELAKQLQEIGR